jgi:hydrogenase/urease accessory protein HupE
VATLALLQSPLPVSAHPGHGLGEHGPAHWFTSPDHLLVLVVAGAGFWLAGRFVQRRWAKHVLLGIGALIVLGSVAWWGLTR